ncbi:urea ABC transporter permease subunit UrtB [Pelagibacteraceae bacterium]|nr:urea ABC transporter permease subunit UrtB [Pelagibacteraceae bacterium]
MKIKFYIIFLYVFFINLPAVAHHDEFNIFLIENSENIIKSSAKTVDSILSDIQSFDDEIVSRFLELWKSKSLYYIKDTKQVVLVNENEESLDALEIDGLTRIGNYSKKEIKKIKPNSGVRAKIDSILVKYQISNSDINVRQKSIESLKRNIRPEHLEVLQDAYINESDAELKTVIDRLLKFAIIKYSDSNDKKLEIIESFKGDTAIEIRASLNQLLNSSEVKVGISLPNNKNIARVIVPGFTIKNSNGTSDTTNFFNEDVEISINDAYDKLYAGNLVYKKRITQEELKKILEQNISGDTIGGYSISSLDNEQSRIAAYNKLVENNLAPPFISENKINEEVNKFIFYSIYNETSSEVTNAALNTLASINFRVQIYKYIDLLIDGLSLASIYFLGAIGLAITFGVMRVINMAHGEFIMMGAYTGYVVQQFISNHTLSLLVALPLAFIITFIAGVIMERLVIRHLYRKPLDTLLATFGISIALQQIAKNIFGTQARPLTSPSWLDGSLSLSDDLSISYIRIAIFILSLIFLGLLLFVMNRTRLGLETRAVTQNPVMASNMGINPERINMLTFGFGSGIAGIAGIAIGLFSKVTSELGSEYIVQSFMTVVVGGVGNIWGTLAGASLIGFLQKFIEWFNPSNTLAAQTYMIIFIILFIQFRPKGIVALKGRAADD